MFSKSKTTSRATPTCIRYAFQRRSMFFTSSKRKAWKASRHPGKTWNASERACKRPRQTMRFAMLRRKQMGNKTSRLPNPAKLNRSQSSNEEAEVFVGSGNVFADLGLPNPEERLQKANIANR